MSLKNESGRFPVRFLSNIDFQTHRAMVGAHDISIDGGIGDLFCDPVGYQEIVNTPSGVVLPGVEPVAPPAVDAGGIGIQIPESVGEACSQGLGEAVSFLVRETCVPPVGGRILQVYFLVGNV